MLYDLSKFTSLNVEDKKKFIESLSKAEKKALYKIPELFLFPKQIAPTGDWRYHLLCAGRGFGKSYASTAWLYSKYLEGYKSLAMCGADYKSVENDLVPMFLNWFSPDDKPKYNSQNSTITCRNGCVIYVYTSQNEIRGPNICYLICDELCKFCDSIEDKIIERFNILDMTVRKGKNPQILISSTPKNQAWFINFAKQIELKNPLYSITVGSTRENPYLPESFIHAMYNSYEGKRIGRQELNAEILTDTPGSLWDYEIIEKNRISIDEFQKRVKLVRTVIGIDPAMSHSEESDETGIIIAGLDELGHVYILNDSSGKHDPLKWANITYKSFINFKCNTVVVEKNAGGNLCEVNLRNVCQNLPIKMVSAKNGKLIRAEPVAALYYKDKVHHVGVFDKLEYQMTHYCANPKDKSPDRLDAMVYAVLELALNNIYINRNFDNIGVYS